MNIDIKKLQCAMASKCYNASDLALYSRLSNATISRIFKTETVLKTQTLGKIAKALDVEPKELIKD
jgi:DNA-binding Xre family transcriptional regulator